jgi:hypothetical protein
MKKLICLIFLILSVAPFVYAQDHQEDVVYLKDGSVIHGNIVERVPNKSIKIKTGSGNIFVYKIDQIKKITKKEIKKGNPSSYSGYQGIVNIGYAIGVGDLGTDRLIFHFINGYRMNNYFYMGFGTGVHYYTDADEALIPIFGDFRAYFLDNDISPYINLNIGYSFNASNGFSGTGLLLNPSVGTSFNVSTNTALNISIGYELQKLKYSIYYYNGYVGSGSVNTGAITINFGVAF